MNRISYFIAIFWLQLVLLPSMAQDYVWKPGGTHQNLKGFQAGDNYAGGDFRGSDFWNMGNIQGVNLDNTNFERSRFGEMYVTNTSFRGANLRFVDGSSLTGEMTGCDLTDADITGSNLPLSGEQLRSTKNYKNKNLAGISIWGTDLSGTSFAGFNLTGIGLIGCNLENCDFTGADITKIAATGLTFDQIKVTKNYKAKDLGETVFMQCDFDNADFRGFKLSVFHECSFLNADFRDVSFVKVKFHDTRYFIHRMAPVDNQCGFSNCQLTRQQFESTRTYRDKDLSQMLLTGMNLDQWNFRDCNLDEAQLIFSSMADADFTNATIEGTNFSNTNVTKKQWQSTKQYQGLKKFMPPTTTGVDLSGYDFSGMTIGVSFFGSALRKADFTDATLINVTFQDSDLTDANFTNAKLNDILFTRGSPLTWEQFLSTQNGQTRNFSRISLAHFPVKGWDFSNAILVEKRWYGCDFPDCVFDNARIDVQYFSAALVKDQSANAGYYEKNGLTREQFQSTANYRSKQLRKANFYGNDLRGMDFTGFDLTDVRFESANLADACFDNAKIQGCQFEYSVLHGQGQLSQEQFYSTATYQRGNIGKIKFFRIDMSGWDFSGKRVVNCRFIDCIFADTNFTDTRFQEVDFACWGQNWPCWDQGWPPEKLDSKLTFQQMKQTWNYQNQKMNSVKFNGYFDDELKNIQ